MLSIFYYCFLDAALDHFHIISLFLPTLDVNDGFSPMVLEDTAFIKFVFGVCSRISNLMIYPFIHNHNKTPVITKTPAHSQLFYLTSHLLGRKHKCNHYLNLPYQNVACNFNLNFLWVKWEMLLFFSATHRLLKKLGDNWVEVPLLSF